MILLTKIILMLTLVTIAYQDIKDKMIYLFLFPLCALCFGFLSFQAMGSDFLLSHLPFNMVVMGITLGMIGLYFRWRYDSAFAKAALGKGDYWMLFTTCFAMASTAFVLFSVAGIMASLVITILLKRLRNVKNQHTEIPLAGYLAVFYMLLFGVNWTMGITGFYY